MAGSTSSSGAGATAGGAAAEYVARGGVAEVDAGGVPPLVQPMSAAATPSTIVRARWRRKIVCMRTAYRPCARSSP